MYAINWLECIWGADLPPNAKYLAAYLNTFMNSKRAIVWPSIERISKETGLGKKEVSKQLKALEEGSWILRNGPKKTINVPDAILNKLNIPIPEKAKEVTLSPLMKEIQESFNTILGPKLGKIRGISPGRKRMLNARIKEDIKREKASWWTDYFEIVTSCPLLMGKSEPMDGVRAWQASFDWLINPNNMIKVLEGKYIVH